MTRVTLFESRLSSSGAAYTALAHANLTAKVMAVVDSRRVSHRIDSVRAASGAPLGRGDLRRVGSGNLGAANVMRASGVTAGVLVAVLDMAKGAASVWLAERVGGDAALPAAAGLAAIVGHIYPVWLRFRGGKGVATACGVFSVLTPLAVPPALAIFAAVVWLTKYISLGSVLASLALPPIAYALGSPAPAVIAAAAASRRSSSSGIDRTCCAAVDRHGAARGSARVMRTVTVLGAGSWGTALAVHLGRVGHDVRLWARDRALVDEMAARRANAVYLPDVHASARASR